MNIKHLFTIFILAATLSVNAQHIFEAPDYDAIEQEIQDSTSQYYYPRLVERFKACDTTLNLEQVRHLYFGYLFQDQRKTNFESKYTMMIAKMLNDAQGKINLNRVESFADSAINEQFLNIDAYYYKFMAVMSLHKNESNPEATLASFPYNSLISAILSTGDGRSPETAFHLISSAHEYNILGVMQLNYDQQNLILENDRYYDELSFGYQNQQKLYFDVTNCFTQDELNNLNIEKKKSGQKTKKRR